MATGQTKGSRMKSVYRTLTATLIITLTAFGSVSALFAKEDRPVAFIELIEHAPDSELQSFDYVYNKTQIDLRPGGQVILAYFDTCEVETITGGLVKIKTDGAKLSKGGTSVKHLRPCRTAKTVLSKAAKEAGASVKRVSPFQAEDWQEWALNTFSPLFKWPLTNKRKGPVEVKVYFADAIPRQLVWQASTSNPYLTYPHSAPALIIGMPYIVVVDYAKGKPAEAVFSIDPALELPEGPINRLVPLE